MIISQVGELKLGSAVYLLTNDMHTFIQLWHVVRMGQLIN